MLTFEKNLFQEVEPHNFVTESSTLGLPPEKPYPDKFTVNLGNSLPFVMVSYTVSAAVYRQEFGCVKITIFND